MLVHIKELFKGNVVGQFAYPAFNTMDLEITKGILEAAEELNTPVILEASEGAIKYAGLNTLYEIMATLAVHAKIPVALHMDHGKDMDQLKEGIGLGFSSVMIDHSHLPYEQNARDTKEMVQFAHTEGAWVQGEIGRIRGSEDWVSVSDEQALLTDPPEALKFYQDTGVDTLACSFGTVHGVAKMSGKAEAHVDVPRIKAVHDLVKIPLVLHGASGVPAETISEAIESGIAIINIDTELRMAYSNALRQSLAADLTEIDPRKIMKPVIESVKTAAEIKLKQFKTQNLVHQ